MDMQCKREQRGNCREKRAPIVAVFKNSGDSDMWVQSRLLEELLAPSSLFKAPLRKLLSRIWSPRLHCICSALQRGNAPFNTKCALVKMLKCPNFTNGLK